MINSRCQVKLKEVDVNGQGERQLSKTVLFWTDRGRKVPKREDITYDIIGPHGML